MTPRKKRALKFTLYGELCLLCFVGLLWLLPIKDNPSWITGPIVTVCVIIKGISLIALTPGVFLALFLAATTSDINFYFPVAGLVVNALLYGTIGYLLGYYTYCPGPGLCQNCEYNLTGNESGICPECGTEVMT